MQVQAVSADIDQPTGHRVRVGVRGLPHGLIAAADRSQQQQRKHRVQQPASAPATQLSVGADKHPDHQRQQRRRPHPVQHLTERAPKPTRSRPPTPMNTAGTAAHRCGWSVNRTESRANSRPTDRESAQDGARDVVFFRADERGGSQEESRDESDRQRSGHDPADVASRLRTPAERAVPVLTRGSLRRDGCGDHDGLDSKRRWRRASTAICTCGTCRPFDTRPSSPIPIPPTQTWTPLRSPVRAAYRKPPRMEQHPVHAQAAIALARVFRRRRGRVLHASRGRGSDRRSPGASAARRRRPGLPRCRCSR